MRVNVSLPDDLVERVDARRGDVSRSRFIRRALEKDLWEPSAEVVRQATAQQRAASANFGALEAEAPPQANAVIRQGRQTPDYEAMKRHAGAQRRYSKPFRPQPKS